MSTTKNIEKKLIKQVKIYYKKYDHCINQAHKFDHTQRVINISKKILKYEPHAKKEIVIYSAILHDIGRYDFHNNHAYTSAKISKSILDKLGLDNEVIYKIIDIIKYHNTRDKKILEDRQNNLEFNILVDADTIDAYGPIGIIRASLDDRFKISKEAQLEHISEKIYHEKRKLVTNGGKIIGQKYLDFLKIFLKTYSEQESEYN